MTVVRFLLSIANLGQICYHKSMRFLNPTPAAHLIDAKGKPYFLWDCDLSRHEFEERIAKNADSEIRAYFVAKLLRQAKPDDAFSFVSAQDIADLWPLMTPYLGKQRDFWDWLLNILEGQGHVKR